MRTSEELLLAVAEQNERPVDQRRCPLCGYTKADQDIHMDHRICEAKGGINFRQLPDDPNSLRPKRRKGRA